MRIRNGQLSYLIKGTLCNVFLTKLISDCSMSKVTCITLMVVFEYFNYTANGGNEKHATRILIKYFACYYV